MAVNVLTRRVNKAASKSPASNQVNRSIGYEVLPELTNSLYRFVSAIGASLPEDQPKIESMTIKGDKVYIRYQASSSPSDECSILANGCAVTSNLHILNIGNGQVLEKLNSVFQVNTSLASVEI